MKNPSAFAAILVVLAGLIASGCVTAPSPQMKDSMAYVRQHRGEGARRVLVGTEAQLVEEATRVLELSYLVTREPNALFAKYKDTTISFSYGFYFHPSSMSGRTEVEALVASNWMEQGAAPKHQRDAISSFFPLADISTRLLEANFDPNVKEGEFFAPLSTAAFHGSSALARKLIDKGANVEAAIGELKSAAARNREYRDRAENNRTYEWANAGVTLLEGLRGGAKPDPAPAAAATSGGKGEIADRLRKLEDLKKQGLVTEEEYKRKKKELLDQL